MIDSSVDDSECGHVVDVRGEETDSPVGCVTREQRRATVIRRTHDAFDNALVALLQQRGSFAVEGINAKSSALLDQGGQTHS